MMRLRGCAMFLLAGILLVLAPVASHAQQTREDLSRGLPSSNLSNDDVHATNTSLLAAPGFALARVADN
ncbi:MAG: hypothetical protein ABW187_03960, partial [Dokdonella sp.]